MKAFAVDIPDSSGAMDYVVANRGRLRANHLARLPLGSVKPGGWIAHQLALMVDGQVGRLQEVSKFLADDNGWLGTDKHGWEEQPYWFRGFFDLGVLTGDERVRAVSEKWIEAIIATQQEDGYFGPVWDRAVEMEDGARIVDLWPHMVMIDALRSYWEVSRDARVVELLTRFFEFCRDLPDDQFIPEWRPEWRRWVPGIQHIRAGDMLPHVYWLYDLTGDEWLLGVATRFHERAKAPGEKWLDTHVVNFTQRFREPANYYVQSNDPRHLAETDHWYDMHMAEWGQQPGGVFGADENIRPGKTDPKQGFETCAMAEFDKSFFILGQITGEAKYADRAEDIVFNSFPASQTPDLKGLHYLTAANQPQLDSSGAHDYQNTGRMIDYSPHMYRCCQHNVAMGWPYYAEHLWMAGPGNGLVAWMYGASEVTAKVGDGREVRVVEETDYPFDTSVRLRMCMDGSVAFPLYLRVPKWCKGFGVSVNNELVDVSAEPGQYVVLDRTWVDGDVVEIEMPVELSLRRWAMSGGSVTVDRGPLSYSLKIGEDWRKIETWSPDWPEWEVFPTSHWNYGLVFDPNDLAGSFEVGGVKTLADQPWTIGNAPIEIRARGRRIANWTMVDETITDLQPSPVKSDEPTEEITLVPMGCARLRISCFPVVGDGPEAREWKVVSSHDEAMALRVGGDALGDVKGTEYTED